MGRKKRRGFVLKPFCYYCDREFDDEKVLIQHQKAKHFKCHHCIKKLDSAIGLAAHLEQVHKEIIDTVPSALEGRDSLDMSIRGMEGIPAEILEEKISAKTEKKDSAKKSRVDWAQVTMAPQSMEQFVMQAQQGQLPTFVGMQPFQPQPGMPPLSYPSPMMGNTLPAPPNLQGLLQNNKAMQMPPQMGMHPQMISPSGIPAMPQMQGFPTNMTPEGMKNFASPVRSPMQATSPGTGEWGVSTTGRKPPGSPPSELAPPPLPPNSILTYSDDQMCVEERRAATFFGYRQVAAFG